MSHKVFSGIDDLPRGTASDEITPGCLLLEGGAFRALYGEGVLDALMEAGINMECTIGVSAGAMNAMTYVAGQIGRAARINLRYRNDSRYVSFRHFFKYGGIINFRFIIDEVPNDPFDYDRFYNSPQRYVAVATNCLTGESTYFEKEKGDRIFRAMVASASMPYVSRMVKIDGIPYLDGGCSIKLPYQWVFDQGYSKLVIIRTKRESLRYPVTRGYRLPYLFYRGKYHQLANNISKSSLDYNAACDEIDELKRQGRVFVISPSEEFKVGRLETDMEKLGGLYYLGYHDGQNAIGDLRAYLQQ